MKTVLVTGGSRGIGRAIVEAFSREGYNVAFTYKTSSDSALEISRKTNALAIRADNASEDDIIRAVELTNREFGSIDVLVNNAAVSSSALITDVSLQEWNDLMSINLTASFLYSKCVIPKMINKKQGRIINISSMWGEVGASLEVAYSTAKAGLIGMTKALAKELGPSGITVNAIAPGLIDTDMNSSLSDEDKADIIESTPLMKIGTTKNIADIALFLASDSAEYITGDVINASGGFVIF